ncbi:MAG: 16S rRNA (cytidine(1402)-2'-O)-methyltransferase [Desulfurivibrio sp.]|nr:16S rRNA (cytidine(1402)-2'-O)-methyltransferase [Desulfurivibrio sp.]
MSADEPQTAAGTLYVVATPIGNLEDITLRALRILQQVDLIAAEDTRHTRKLLNHFAITTPCLSYYRQREAARSAEILARLAAGAAVALVADAGTPGIADPGGRLVAEARQAGFPVLAVPGPSALGALLSVAGRPEAAHLFLGFLPSRAAERERLLREVQAEPRALIFYEAPHRLLKSLAACREILGDRPAVVGRELTKLHEEILSGNLSGIAEQLAARPRIKGELVVLVAGRPPADRACLEEQEVAAACEQLAARYRDSEQMSLKDAARRIAAELNLPKTAVYRQLLQR